MSRYALIDEGGVVVNVIEWDGGDGWSPPDGMTAEESDLADIGWVLGEDGVLSPVAPVENEDAQYAAN